MASPYFLPSASLAYRHAMVKEELALHIELRDFASAAAIQQQMGNIDEAIELYGRAGGSEAGSQVCIHFYHYEK
jgi:hypothetical protein